VLNNPLISGRLPSLYESLQPLVPTAGIGDAPGLGPYGPPISPGKARYGGTRMKRFAFLLAYVTSLLAPPFIVIGCGGRESPLAFMGAMALMLACMLMLGMIRNQQRLIDELQARLGEGEKPHLDA
jgi:hypothetical protein